MEHPPTSAIEDSARNETDAVIASLQAALNEMHIRAVDAESGYPCIAERDATIAKLKEQKASIITSLTDAVNEIADRKADAARLQDALDTARNDRASIVAFLTAEADRLAAASRAARGDFVEDYGALDRYCDGLMAQSDDRRTLAAQIARGDDRQGGE